MPWAAAKEVVSLDSSRPALELAERNLALNGFEVGGSELLKGDAFTYLKECDTAFDIIVLDPPSLARKRGDVDGATGGYKFLNLHALRHEAWRLPSHLSLVRSISRSICSKRSFRRRRRCGDAKSPSSRDSAIPSTTR